jgi:hypothetical protein
VLFKAATPAAAPPETPAFNPFQTVPASAIVLLTFSPVSAILEDMLSYSPQVCPRLVDNSFGAINLNFSLIEVAPIFDLPLAD